MPVSWTPVVDGVDDVMASHVNDLYDEVELGTLRGWYSRTLSSSDNVTLTDADMPLQFLTAVGGSLNLYLPAEAVANHSFVVVNESSDANTWTVKNDSSDTIGTVAQDENKQFVSNGVAWELMTTGGGAATQITETSGPTTLDITTIGDGEYLKRDGTTVVGGTPAGGGGAVRNLLINGGFDFFQRINPTTATAMTDDAYNAPDRWYSLIQGANATIERVAGGYNSPSAAKLVAGGTTNRFGIATILESKDSIVKRGKTETFQMMVKPVKNAGSGTMKVRIAILEWTGTADAVTSELVADWTSATFTTAGFFASTTKTLVGTASVTTTHNTWTQVSVSGAISTSCNNLIVFVWTEDAPAHAADYLLLSEAGLYDAAAVQDWNPIPYAQERILCQRYCAKSYAIDTAPGSADGYNQTAVGCWNAAVSTNCSAKFPLPTEMFAAPVLSIWASNSATGSGTLNRARNDSSGGLVVLTGSNTTTQEIVNIVGEANFTSANNYSFNYLAVAEL
jgi:hypothetical protein